MSWKKQGLVYAPEGDLDWSQDFCIMPTGDVLEDKIRVYFGTVDQAGDGRIGYVDLDIENPSCVVAVASEPVLGLGPTGTFDSDSVTPSCVVNNHGWKYLYYVGWQRLRAEGAVQLLVGLATSRDGENFSRWSNVPILERTEVEPFWRTAICVRREKFLWKAWYSSGLKWTEVCGKPYPEYVIRYATSYHGLDWIPNYTPVLDLESEGEFALGRPWVVKDEIYKMWYSIRGRDLIYRMGYAESGDGVKWTRKDDRAGIKTSATGWDSQMVEYPCVVDLPLGRVMFYNGNQHGRDGFGWAVWEG